MSARNTHTNKAARRATREAAPGAIVTGHVPSKQERREARIAAAGGDPKKLRELRAWDRMVALNGRRWN